MGVWLLAYAGCPETSSSGEGRPIPIRELLLVLVLPMLPVLCVYPEFHQYEPGTELKSPVSACHC